MLRRKSRLDKIDRYGWGEKNEEDRVVNRIMLEKKFKVNEKEMFKGGNGGLGGIVRKS